VTIPPTTGPTSVLLHDDEAVDLAWLLGEVEDWLLHAEQGVRDDLDDFLGPAVLGSTRVGDVIDLLGRYSSLIGRRHRGDHP
jgi:hypothetical protein